LRPATGRWVRGRDGHLRRLPARRPAPQAPHTLVARLAFAGWGAQGTAVVPLAWVALTGTLAPDWAWLAAAWVGVAGWGLLAAAGLGAGWRIVRSWS
jgi:hypothetical protein